MSGKLIIRCELEVLTGMHIGGTDIFSAIGAVDSPLTERETTVLRRTADGCSPREVATSMHLSYGTVRNYLASAVTKLGARNRVDAIRIATEAGWL